MSGAHTTGGVAPRQLRRRVRACQSAPAPTCLLQAQLAVREGPDGSVSVHGAREVPVHSAADLLCLLGDALAARCGVSTPWLLSCQGPA